MFLRAWKTHFLEARMRSGFLGLRRYGAAASLAVISLSAHAHTGHEASDLIDGLVHPLGLDHLLAMVAVGLWSVYALPQRHVWWGPATFMAALITSAALGFTGIEVPLLEHLVSLSVVLFGVMLLLIRQKIPAPLGLALVAVAASLHGLAHGAETPKSGFAGYATGFLLTTALLHFGGVVIGINLKGRLAERSTTVIAGLGGMLSLCGVYLWATSLR
jgi:urease accessory protein